MKRLSYGEYMKTGLKIDKLKQQADNIQSIMSQLNANSAHKSTGIIYDYYTLSENYNRLQEEIESLNKLMDNNK